VVRRQCAIFAIGGITEYTETNDETQLIDIVSVKTGRQKPEVDVVLESVLAVVAEALHENQRVDIRGFGSFVVKERKERQGRNPRTGESITIAAKRNVRFESGQELSDTLIESKTENRHLKLVKNQNGQAQPRKPNVADHLPRMLYCWLCTPRRPPAIEPGAHQRREMRLRSKPLARRYDNTSRKFQQDPTFNLIGRPRGPRMKYD
jgi:DNA-binding protein HU-beta